MRQMRCMAYRRSGPPFSHKTEEFGAKRRVGPSPRVAGHVRWAGAGLGEGGAALHTHPLLPGQVLVIWGGREGGMVVEGKVVGRGRTDRPDGASTNALVDSTGARRFNRPREVGSRRIALRGHRCRCVGL